MHVLRGRQAAARILRLPLPAGEKQMAHWETRQWVRFGIEDDLVKGQEVVWREEEVEVL
jgi:hypothetical protein